MMKKTLLTWSIFSISQTGAFVPLGRLPHDSKKKTPPSSSALQYATSFEEDLELTIKVILEHIDRVDTAIETKVVESPGESLADVSSEVTVDYVKEDAVVTDESDVEMDDLAAVHDSPKDLAEEDVLVIETILEEPEEEEEDYHSAFELAMEKLRAPDNVATLARLACAFPPPGHQPSLENVQEMQVLALDGKHVELAAVIGSGGGQCAAVAIPISFPSPCLLDDKSGSIDVLVECIMNNVKQLDELALVKLEKEEQEQESAAEQSKTEEEEDSSSADKWAALTIDDITDFPDWWTFPGISPSVGEECDNLKEMLNEDDLQPDLQSLVQKALADNAMDDYSVQRAAVTLIGTSGIFLRAFVGEGESVTRIELPIPFGQEAKDADTLRDLMVDTLETL